MILFAIPISACALWLLAPLRACASEAQPEPWVKASEIVSAKPIERDTAAVAPGVTVAPHAGGGLWSPEIQDRSGVLIVHPPGRSAPAVIRPNLGDLNRRKDQHLLVSDRGSNHMPGARLVIAAGDTVLAETTQGKEWTITSVPVETLLRTPGKVELRFHPTGWMFEYAYVDSIALREAPKAPAEASAAPGDPAFTTRLTSGPWKWEAKAEAKPAWEEVVFRPDGGFGAFRAGKEVFTTRWRSPRAGMVDILQDDQAGMTLDFGATGLVFQARRKGTPIAVGRPKDWKGLSVDPATDVGQNQGGKSATMEDLKFILLNLEQAGERLR